MSEKTMTWPKETFKLYFAISSNDFRDSKENSKLQRNTTMYNKSDLDLNDRNRDFSHKKS